MPRPLRKIIEIFFSGSQFFTNLARQLESSNLNQVLPPKIFLQIHFGTLNRSDSFLAQVAFWTEEILVPEKFRLKNDFRFSDCELL